MLVIPIPETSTSKLKIFVLVFFSENCIQDGGSRGSSGKPSRARAEP